MVAPQHIPVGGHEIHAVFILVGRGAEIRVQLVDARCNKTGVDEVAGGHATQPQQEQNDCAHGLPFVIVDYVVSSVDQRPAEYWRWSLYGSLF